MALVASLGVWSSALLGVAAAPAALATEVPSPAAASAGDPEQSALATAVATGRRVAVDALTTETQQVFADPSGVLTMRLSAEPERVRTSTGWTPVDTTLERQSDGSIAPKAVALPQTFSGGGKAPLVELGTSGGPVSLSAPFALPAPTLDGNRATYAEVLPGVDLVVTAQADAFSEVLVVKSREAAKQPALSTLRFHLASTGLSVRRTSSGGIEALDHLGLPVLTAPQPLMWDSGEQAASAQPSKAPAAAARAVRADAGANPSPATSDAGVDGPGDASSVSAMDVGVNGSTVSVLPDSDLLKDQDTIYPVYIDPTFKQAKPTGWAMVDSLYPSQEYWKFTDEGGQGLGYNTTGGSHLKRLFYMFNTAGLVGKTITRAKFRAFEKYSYSCTKSEVVAFRTKNISSSTNWDNQPDPIGKELDSQTVAYGWGKDCYPGGRDVDFDVMKGVKDAVGAKVPATTVTFGLRAGNEKSAVGWKRFTQAAALEVDYNTTPGTPASLRMADPTGACATGDKRLTVAPSNPPTLVAKLSDADGSDGQKVSAKFEVWKSGGTAALQSISVSAKALPKDSGDYLATTVKAGLADGVYKWHVQGTDDSKAPNAASAWSAWCEFSVDGTAPDKPPTITPRTGNSYTLGASPVFDLGPGEAKDVVSYKYSLNGGAKTATPTGTPTVLTLPALKYFGPNTLTVWSYDKTGNESPGQSFSDAEDSDSFEVTGTELPRDRWQADEGQGAKAADIRPKGTKYEDGFSTVPANALTLTGGTTWGKGRRSADDTGEAVLTFDGVDGEAASSVSKLVDVSAPWSVLAHLRPALRKQRQVAVSEDAGTGSAFAIAVVPQTTKDPETGLDDVEHHFAVTIDNPTAGAADVTCTSGVSLVEGEWYSVGVWYSRSITGDTVTIRVRGAGSVEQTPCSVSFTPAASAGALRLGRARSAGKATDAWRGDIDEVQTFEGVIDGDIQNTRSDDPRYTVSD
jgi:hypothetical protein